MAGQVYAVSSLGGYGAVPQLTAEVRDQSQPLIRFRQFCDLIDGYGGSRKGDTFNWDIVSNVATGGGTLVETSTIPRTNFVITQGTGSITEYGNAIKSFVALLLSFVDNLCPKVFGFRMAWIA